MAACGGRTQADDAPPASAPTGIPVAAANASGLRFPQAPLVAPHPTRTPPTGIAPPPVDPFGLPPEMLDAGPPSPVPPKKKGTHL
jgi:hypothetical protein